MSEPIPESIPTFADPRSKRPVKKRALTPRSAVAADVEALFAKPDREIQIPGAVAKRGLGAPPEIVANVQGSSAGAGSGEFHVYKASRRREYERLRLMDEEVKKEDDEKAFQERKTEQEKKDRAKTEKNRARREKQMARKAKYNKTTGNSQKTEGDKSGTIKKFAPNPALVRVQEDENDEVMSGGGEVRNSEEIGLVIHDDD